MPVNLQLLEQNPTFSALQPQQRHTLAGLLEYRHFHSGTTICVQGEPGATMYFIETGEVAFYTHDAGGEEKTFRTLKAGEFFGEVAVLSEGTRSANARAISEVFAWELHRNHFDTFVRTFPEMAVTMLKGMAQRMDNSAAMLRDTVSPSIAQTIDQNRTDMEKLVDQLVRRIGGLPFLVVNLFAGLVWILVNRFLPTHLDSREFGFLALLLGIEALSVTVLVLAKQNRDEKDANIRNDTIMAKVQTTPMEIQHLRDNVNDLTELIRAERHDRLHNPKRS